NERDIVFREFDQWIGFGKIGKYRLGMGFRVADDIGHPCFAPTFVNGGMTSLAGSRTCELRIGLAPKHGARESQRESESLRGAHNVASPENHQCPILSVSALPRRAGCDARG